MKLSKVTHHSLFPIIAVLLIAVLHAKPSTAVSTADDHRSNVDLRHLISILDSNGTSGGTTSQNTDHNRNVADQSTKASSSPKTVLIKRKVKVKKYAESSTVGPQVTPTNAPPPSITSSTTRMSTSTTTSKPPIVSSTTSTVSFNTTTLLPSMKNSNFPVKNNSNADRRIDSHIDTLQEIAPPSQQDLVNQLSLLNSLLTSLGDNSTTTESPTTTSKSTTSTPTSATESSSKNVAIDNPTREDQQALAALSAIFGGSDATAALLNSNVVPRQISSGAETEAAKALSEFLVQAAAIDAQKSNNGHSSHPSTNLNTASAASNQFSSLVSLLGTLNSFAQQPNEQDQFNNNNGFSSSQNIQQSQQLDPQQLLSAFEAIHEQQQRQNPTAQPNSLADILGQVQSHSPFGKLLTSQGAGGILSSVGAGLTSLGSSMFTTVSNIFSGSGFGGKPRVRGVDTRMGLGYRFGDAADAQIMFDVGPQLFTETVKNELRSPTMGKKSHTVDPNEELIRSLSGGGKHQEDVSAAKRVLQLQLHREMRNHHLNQKQFSPTAITPKKPLSLLDIWNAGKEFNVAAPRLQIPDQLLTPPLNEADMMQMKRNKNFRKRSSTSLKNYYSKPLDDPLAGHSTLTAYEQMLITQGRDLGAKFSGGEDEEPIPTRRPKRRRKFRQRQPIILEEEEKIDDILPETEYGSDNGLDESPSKNKKPTRKGSSRTKKKRPSKMRPRPPNDKHKWKPRGNDNLEDVTKEEDVHPDHKPTRDGPGSRERTRDRTSKESSRSRSKENKSRERYDKDVGEEDDQRPDDRPPPSRDDFNFRQVEPKQAHSESRPQFDDGINDYNDEAENTEMMDDFDPPERSRDDDDDHADEVRHGSKERPRSDERTRGKPKKMPNEDPYYWPKDKPQVDFRHESKENYNTFSKERPYHNSQHGPSERPYDDGFSDDDGPRHIKRPKQKDSFKDDDYHAKREHRPVSKPKPIRPPPSSSRDHKKSPSSKFSLAKIFHYWVRKGRRQSNKGKPSKKPPTDRSHHLSEDENSADEAYERFTYRQPDLPKSRSDDRFHSRNTLRPRRPRPQSSFNRKTSLSQVWGGAIGGSAGGIPYKNFHQIYSPQINPEANDSFLRRNQVAVNNRLKEIERQKLLEAQSQPQTDSSFSEYEDGHPSPSPTNSVMSFVKNYFASKTTPKQRVTDPEHKTNGGSNNNGSNKPKSISTLAKLISNPSALNPLKILPIRRNRVRPPTSTPPTPNNKKPQVRHKLAVIGGKLQIVNVTVIPTTTTTTESPVVHIGDDMSFEELTQVLSQVKKNQKKKLKLKVKTTTTPEPDQHRKVDYDDEDDVHVGAKAAEKVDADDNLAKSNHVEEQQDPEYDTDDGLKGIFIDIESGEVNVLKPVAELTSFLPKKEEDEESNVSDLVADELDDEDGDGIADQEMRRKTQIFTEIQTELKKNYDKMKKEHERVDAKKRRKEQLAAKGMDESIDVVSKYFDMVEKDDDEDDKPSKYIS